MSGLDLGSGSTVPVLTGRRSVGARSWFVIGLLVLVPIPLLALSGIGLPLPSVIERGLAAILPGGSSPRVPAGPGSPARSTPTSSLKRPVSLHTGGSATLTRPHRPSTRGSGGSSSPRDSNTGDPTAAPGGPGTDGGSGPTVGTGTPPGTSGVGAGTGGGGGGGGGDTGAGAGVTVGVNAGGASVGASTSSSGTGSGTSAGASAPDG